MSGRAINAASKRFAKVDHRSLSYRRELPLEAAPVEFIDKVIAMIEDSNRHAHLRARVYRPL